MLGAAAVARHARRRAPAPGRRRRRRRGSTGASAGPRPSFCARPSEPSAPGDLDAALRLRFRAGLLDLDQRELIELRPALTNRELLRDVPSATLEELVEGFEAVAYGGRPAETGDVRTARDGWPRVPEEAGKR